MTSYPDIQLYIDGKWRTSTEHLPIVNPSDEKQIGLLPIADQNNLDDAITAAQKGFAVWSRTAPVERRRIILKAAQLLRE